MKHSLVAISLLAAVSTSVFAADDAKELAFIRFDNGVQSYAGMKYFWLGDGDITLTIDVKPAPDRVLELLWGSKNDTRTGTANIAGKDTPIRSGGYDGFRWIATALPDKVAGDKYTIVLKQNSGKPGFIAAARLVPKGSAGSNSPPKKGAHKISCKATARPRPAAGSREPAFPEMRKVWASPAPEPAKPHPDKAIESAFRRAERNGRQANEQFFRCRKFVDGWLATADEKTGLISRNLGRNRDIWNAKDSAADNYPYMVLTAALTDRKLFDGRMLDMLRTETKLTSRIGRLPDTWSFSKQAFASSKPNLDSIIFGGSEYVKDGLLPLTEWLGKSPWSVRMIGILDDIFANARIDTPYGKIPSTNIEVNGEMLQSLSRIYWMTGDKKYLAWAIRLGDYYLLGDHHPTENLTSLKLRDHGCEITDGLAELYVAVSFARPDKANAYRKPIHTMFDRILKVGTNEHGMMYDSINPKSGDHSKGLCDTWGYNYNGIYVLYMVDKTAKYRDAVRKVLSNLNEHYKDHPWRGADSYADSIEGAICLFNRERVDTVEEWLDSEIKDMWRPQRPDGVVEGWHGDGNSARTSIMYALFKTQGAHVRPWRKDVRIGAVMLDENKKLCISLIAAEDWSGKIIFDRARHKVQMRLPIDYTRINQFPEWFAPDAKNRWTVSPGGESFTGPQLHAGMDIKLKGGVEMRLIVSPNK
ncbi:MAG: hypothetical protein QGG42_05210 [Phycisphaerae bacterium]|jgi:hypothetical protein|nr:hypothetical protein [Phycisphaerae bacterium]